MSSLAVETVETKATKERKNAHIRWLIRRDIPEVLDIERKSFKEPWNEDDFLVHLRHRNCIGMVAEVGEKVIGFFIYELHSAHLRLINLAVHPDYRGQGIGEQATLKLQSKLSYQRTHIVALVPESCLEVQSFFKRYDINASVRLTENKGKMTCKPVFSTMTKKDVAEVQVMEDEVLHEHDREPQNIGEMIAKGSRYGIIARDKSSGVLLGYVLYERDNKGIVLNGEFGVIVGHEYRKCGIGRALVQELVKQKLPINLYDVCPTCKNQVEFLRAVGVPVPKLQHFVNVEWRPEETKK